MKKILGILLPICTFNAFAMPYIGAEYGVATSNHDFIASFPQDSRTLEPEIEQGVWNAFIGYAINDNWGIELTYGQFSFDAEQQQFNGLVTNTNGQQFASELNWDADIKAQQIGLVSAYTHQLSHKWIAKAKLGLTYTQYETSSRKYEEQELILNDDVEINIPLSSYAKKHDEFGAMIALGTEYFVLPQLSVGVNAKYQIDGFANTASFNFGSTYYF